jgi:protein-S-isoprenylcysteine O-methyltransferase Ste14
MSSLQTSLKWVAAIVGLVVVWVLTGRWDLPMVWATFGVYLGALAASWFFIFRKDPELLKERQEPGPGAKDWDRRWLRIYGATLLIIVVVALLDVGRFHWSDTVPLWLQIASLLGLMASMLLTGWAFKENRFFSEVVRIQHDRGHHVVTTGPYRYVRHPGYAGNMISFPCFALSIGSWLALMLTVVLIVLFVIRTSLEDRTLQEELAGYEAYAQQVRYRLVPGIW